jgi:NhaA family Na+:H+ antiporter
VGVTLGLCSIPKEIKKKDILGVGLLAGIGFTMSIFITLLAFNENVPIISSKISILITFFIAGSLGYLWLYFTLPSKNFTAEVK